MPLTPALKGERVLDAYLSRCLAIQAFRAAPSRHTWATRSLTFEVAIHGCAGQRFQ